MAAYRPRSPQGSGFTLFLVGAVAVVVAFTRSASILYAFSSLLFSGADDGRSVTSAVRLFQTAIVPAALMVVGGVLAVIGLVQILSSKRFHSETVSVGGNYIRDSNVGSFVSLQNVHGRVALEIQQLARLNTDHARRVADSLNRLTQMLINDPVIPLERKQQALDQVGTLAAVARTNKSPQAQAKAGTALHVIREILADLPVASSTLGSVNAMVSNLIQLFGLGEHGGM